MFNKKIILFLCISLTTMVYSAAYMATLRRAGNAAKQIGTGIGIGGTGLALTQKESAQMQSQAPLSSGRMSPLIKERKSFFEGPTPVTSRYKEAQLPPTTNTTFKPVEIDASSVLKSHRAKSNAAANEQVQGFRDQLKDVSKGNEKYQKENAALKKKVLQYKNKTQRAAQLVKEGKQAQRALTDLAIENDALKTTLAQSHQAQTQEMQAMQRKYQEQLAAQFKENQLLKNQLALYGKSTPV